MKKALRTVVRDSYWVALAITVGFTLAISSSLAADRADMIRVACVGDSITAGARVDAESESYPAALQRTLVDTHEVKNFGIGGATLIKTGRPNVWQTLDAVKEFQPHIVVVSLGTNDTVGGNRRNWQQIRRFDDDYTALISTLAELPTKPRIVLCTPTAMVLQTDGLSEDRLADLAERQPRLQQLCERVRRLAAGRAAQNVSLLELNAVIKDRPDLVTEGDGVHPNAKGYLAISAAVAGHIRSEVKRKPNIVFFLVDDMGWQDTSEPFHTETTELNRRYHTPHMQRLAREGMKFTQAYSCAVCSPSRVSLMTGMNAARHMVTNWTLRKDRQPDPKHPRVKPAAWNLNGMSPTPSVDRAIHAVTLPMLLREAGYRTIHCGKAHFGAKDTPGEEPLNLGFDVNIAGHAAGGPGSYHGRHNFSAAWRSADRIWDVPGLETYHGQDIHLTEALTCEAIKSVEQALGDDVPFYLYMSHYAIHAPWEEDNRFHEKYLDAGLEGLPAVYASMIEGMDRSLGDLLACLERNGVAHNTIVVFTSDNGQPKQVPRNVPLRGHKLTPYEGGVRVPMIVRWPGETTPDSVCDDRYVIIEDIFPTLLEVAGITAYEQIGGHMDGVSMVPLLRGDTDVPRDRPIFWHFPHTYDQPPYSSVRAGDWKLIYHHITRQLELFNLRDDLGESEDLSQREPDRTEQLATTLGEFLRATNAGMTIDLVTDKPVEYPDELAAEKSR